MTDKTPSPGEPDELAQRIAALEARQAAIAAARAEPAPAPRRGFNAWTLATFGVGPVALFTVLSERGEGVVTTLSALPRLAATWTAESPIGGWTLLAAVLVPALVVVRLNGLLGTWANKHTKEVALDLVGIAGAFAIAYVLIPTVPGALIGIAAATFVSTTERWLRAIFRRIELARLTLDPEE